MRIPDLCTCLCTELSETHETGCNACDVVDGGSSLTCVFETVCHC